MMTSWGVTPQAQNTGTSPSSMTGASPNSGVSKFAIPSVDGASGPWRQMYVPFDMAYPSDGLSVRSDVRSGDSTHSLDISRFVGPHGYDHVPAKD